MSSHTYTARQVECGTARFERNKARTPPTPSRRHPAGPVSRRRHWLPPLTRPLGSKSAEPWRRAGLGSVGNAAYKCTPRHHARAAPLLVVGASAPSRLDATGAPGSTFQAAWYAWQRHGRRPWCQTPGAGQRVLAAVDAYQRQIAWYGYLPLAPRRVCIASARQPQPPSTPHTTPRGPRDIAEWLSRKASHALDLSSSCRAAAAIHKRAKRPCGSRGGACEHGAAAQRRVTLTL